MELTFNVDSDGCLYDWHGFMIPFLSERLGVEMTREDFKTWDLAAALGVPKREFYRHFDDAVFEGCFLKGYAIPSAIRGLEALLDAGHRVRIVTSKLLPYSSMTLRAEQDFLSWFSQFGLLDRVEVVFTGSKYGKQGYPANVVIDDKPDLKWTQKSAVNVLFDQPWNRSLGPLGSTELRDVVGQYPGVLYRASGWDEVLELAEQMGGGLLKDKSPVVV